MECFKCPGEYVEVFQDYESPLGIIPNIPFLICGKCGSKVLGEKGNTLIDEGLVKLGWKPRKSKNEQ